MSKVNDLLRTMPPVESFNSMSPDSIEWLGRASAVAHSWDSLRATVKFDPVISKIQSATPNLVSSGFGEILLFLHHVRHDLAMLTEKPLSVNVGAGLVFDYFDEIRKAIEIAKIDILFIDPYLDAEFVSRYLPHIAAGVNIRLLAREKIATLLPAVDAFQQQSSRITQVRTATSFHDRFFIVDGATCYQSGSSFKDGAKKSPTTLTEVLDAFPGIKATYEEMWLTATPQR